MSLVVCSVSLVFSELLFRRIRISKLCIRHIHIHKYINSLIFFYYFHLYFNIFTFLDIVFNHFFHALYGIVFFFLPFSFLRFERFSYLSPSFSFHFILFYLLVFGACLFLYPHLCLFICLLADVSSLSIATISYVHVLLSFLFSVMLYSVYSSIKAPMFVSFLDDLVGSHVDTSDKNNSLCTNYSRFSFHFWNWKIKQIRLISLLFLWYIFYIYLPYVDFWWYMGAMMIVFFSYLLSII